MSRVRHWRFVLVTLLACGSAAADPSEGPPDKSELKSTLYVDLETGGRVDLVLRASVKGGKFTYTMENQGSAVAFSVPTLQKVVGGKSIKICRDWKKSGKDNTRYIIPAGSTCELVFTIATEGPRRVDAKECLMSLTVYDLDEKGRVRGKVATTKVSGYLPK
jgi:hypothetical protein